MSATVVKSELGIEIERPALSPPSTALVIVDMIRGYVEPELGIGSAAAERGNLNEYYYRRVQETTLPAIQTLLEAFRSRELPVAHVRIRGDDPQARDWPAAHRDHLLGRRVLPCRPGVADYEWAKGLEPEPSEVVLEKRSISAFTTTGIARILQARGVTHLLVCGVVTAYGVGHTAIDGVDHGFHVTIPEEGTAGHSAEAHDAWLRWATHVYLRVVPAAQALGELSP